MLKEYDIQDINYTVRKLKEANFLNVTITGSKQMEWIEIESLTFQGHEFLENIKGSKVWSETKNKVAKLGSASLTILADVASTVIKKHLNLE